MIAIVINMLIFTIAPIEALRVVFFFFFVNELQIITVMIMLNFILSRCIYNLLNLRSIMKQ